MTTRQDDKPYTSFPHHRLDAHALRGARAEACEAAAALEALGRLRLVPEARAGEVIQLLGRLAAMLTRLIQAR